MWQHICINANTVTAHTYKRKYCDSTYISTHILWQHIHINANTVTVACWIYRKKITKLIFSKKHNINSFSSIIRHSQITLLTLKELGCLWPVLMLRTGGRHGPNKCVQHFSHTQGQRETNNLLHNEIMKRIWKMLHAWILYAILVQNN